MRIPRKYTLLSLLIYFLVMATGIYLQTEQANARTIIYLQPVTVSSREVYHEKLCPGDRVTSTLKVRNTSETDVRFHAAARLIDGDPALYHLLQLAITERGNVLFSGSLNQIGQPVELGTLSRNGTSPLDVTVHFPIHAGNEYQNMSATLSIDFTAIAIEEPGPGPGSAPANSRTPAPSVQGTKPAGSTSTPNPSHPVLAETTSFPSPANQNLPVVRPSPTVHAEPAAAVSPDITELTPSESHSGPAPVPEAHGGLDLALPDTSSPWHNLLLISIVCAILSGIAWRRMKKP
jgi:hypothetical protein